MATASQKRVTIHALTDNDIAFLTLCAAGLPYWNTASAHRIAYPNSKATDSNIKKISWAKIREPAMVEKYNEILSNMTNGKVSAPRTTPTTVLPKKDLTDSEMENMVATGVNGGKEDVLRICWDKINDRLTSDELKLKYMKVVTDIENMKKQESSDGDEKKTTLFYLPIRCESCSLFRNSQVGTECDRCKSCEILKYINAMPEVDKNEFLNNAKTYKK